jgi:hypothetical protein
MNQTPVYNNILFYFGQKICLKLSEMRLFYLKVKVMGGDSKNFLCKLLRFFVTLGLNILRLFKLKVLFEADIIKGWC